MKKSIEFIKDIIKVKKDILFIPLFGGFLCFVQAISIPELGFSWAKDINIWINSFLSNVVCYMIFDLILKRFSFFRKHSTFVVLLSFLVSTLFSQSIVYKIQDNLKPINFLGASLSLVAGFIGFFIIVCVGLLTGKDKAEIELEKLENDYKDKLDKLSKHDRKKIRHYCEKALQLDDATFELISIYKDKNLIKSVKKDLDDVIQKKQNK